MTYTIKYMRYYSDGLHLCDTLSEAVSWAMWNIEDGWCAPMAILGPDGTVAVDKPTLSKIYSEQFGVIETDEIVRRLHADEPA